MPISVKKDGKETWGIINEKGEEVVKPTTKIKNIGNVKDEKFTYYNGEGWGLMNTKGETLIRAKYEFLYFDGDNMLVAIVKKDADTFESKYVNEKDEQIGEDTYVSATPFTMFDGEHAIVKPNDKIYSIISKEGKQVEGLPDIVEIGTFEGESYIQSDYVDFKALIADCKISELLPRLLRHRLRRVLLCQTKIIRQEICIGMTSLMKFGSSRNLEISAQFLKCIIQVT